MGGESLGLARRASFLNSHGHSTQRVVDVHILGDAQHRARGEHSKNLDERLGAGAHCNWSGKGVRGVGPRGRVGLRARALWGCRRTDAIVKTTRKVQAVFAAARRLAIRHEVARDGAVCSRRGRVKRRAPKRYVLSVLTYNRRHHRPRKEGQSVPSSRCAMQKPQNTK